MELHRWNYIDNNGGLRQVSQQEYEIHLANQARKKRAKRERNMRRNQNRNQYRKNWYHQQNQNNSPFGNNKQNNSPFSGTAPNLNQHYKQNNSPKTRGLQLIINL